MDLDDLLAELRVTFPAGATSGTFDATRVSQGEYVPLLRGMGVDSALALTSRDGWTSDGTTITLAGTSATPVLGVTDPAVYIHFSPDGDDWLFVLDIELPTSWTFPQSFPLLDGGVFAELQLAASPAALVIASGPGVDPLRQISAAPLPIVAGITFYGTFARDSSAFAQIAWLLDGETMPPVTGAIAFDVASGAVDLRIDVATGSLPNLFGTESSPVLLQVALSSGHDDATAQYAFGVLLEATIDLGAAGAVALSALLQQPSQPILELAITGTALEFPSTATLAQFFGTGNGIVEALPTDLQTSSLLQVDSIQFGIGVQSRRLEYAMLGVTVTPGTTWTLLPGLLVLSDIQLQFSIFQPFTTHVSAFTATGMFTLGGVAAIRLEAQLPAEILSGSLDPTQPEPSVTVLAQSVFGFDNGIPSDLVVSRAEFRADIPNGQYSVDLEIDGEWAFDFGDDEVVFEELRLALVHDSAGLVGTVEARFEVDADNAFDIEFEMTPGNTRFFGSWQDRGSPITYRTLAIALGMYGLPNLPDGMDLGLDAATFEFDSATPSFSFAIETKLYTGGDVSDGDAASAALVAGKNAAGTAWGFQFGMVVGLNERLELTDIPLVGQLVPVGDDVIALQDVRIVAATTTLPVYEATGTLTTIFGPVVNSGLVLSLDVAVGDADRQQFSVRFGGSDDGSAADVPASPPPALAPAALTASDTPASIADVTSSAPSTGAPPGQQVTWLDVQRAFGPVHVTRVGFSVVEVDGEQALAVLLDAEVALGGLSIGLTGLEAIMSIQSPFTPTFGLAGLAVSFHAAALAISGALAKVPAVSPAEYTGELALTVGDVGAAAFGSYTTVDGSPSLFAFVFVDAPLGGPPAFFVTGLAGGFGYNRSLRLPAVGDVATYPLVQGAMGTLDAEQAQAHLDDYISPAPNEQWFAAGIRFTSFEMVRSFALLTVAFGTNVEIALLGQSTVAIPVSTAENPQEPVARADLLVVVDVQPNNGVVAIQGQLSPSSYVLSQAAQLTGGFAFYVWFGPSPHAGDFVTTLGGYHPQFVPPDHYPTVPRLGLNWQVSSDLTVKGGLYFALTPSVVMAGGALSATWQSGGISAWFDANADFLIRFKPFVYGVDVAVSVGFSVRINLLLTSYTVTAHAGITVHLWGPPFGGVAVVDLSLVRFTMAFGASRPPIPTIEWGEFRDSFLPPVDSGHGKLTATSREADVAVAPDVAPTSTDSLVTISAPTGLLRTFTQDGTSQWVVNGGTLTLAIGTAVPSTSVTTTPTIAVVPSWTTALGVGPMGAAAGSLTCTLAVVVERDGADDTDGWSASAVLGNVPAGLWQNTANTMQTQGSVADALLGLRLTPAPPTGESTVPVPVAELLDDDPPVRDISWSTAHAADGDSFDQSQAMAELQRTLVDPVVSAARTDILSALRAQGASTAAAVDLGSFATVAPDVLVAPPALRTLGEVAT